MKPFVVLVLSLPIPSPPNPPFPEQAWGLFKCSKTQILGQQQRGSSTDIPRSWGWHAKWKTVSMDTGTLKMLSEMAPWGSVTNKNMSMQRPKYSCTQGDSSHWVLARTWLWNKGTEHNPMMFLIFYSVYTTVRGSILLKLQKCRGHLILSSWITCHEVLLPG